MTTSTIIMSSMTGSYIQSDTVPGYTPSIFIGSGTFSGPTGCTVDTSGNLYVADTNANVIRMVAPNGTVTTIAGSGTQGTVNAVGTSAQFNQPYDITIDSSGNLYVVDLGSSNIRKITVGPSRSVSVLAGNNNSGSPIDLTGTSARFNGPKGIAIDTAGNVYIADTGNNLIRKITPLGAVTTIAGGGSVGGTAPGNSPGVGTNALFATPSSLDIDSSGNLYILDQFSALSPNSIKKLTQPNIVTEFIQVNANSQHVALDTSGNIFVTSNNTLQLINISNVSIKTITGGSILLYSLGITAKSGTLYVTTAVNNYIVKVLYGPIQLPLLLNSANGYIGIGSNAPRYTLDVNGAINSLSSITSVASISSLAVSSLTGIYGYFSTLTVSSLTGYTAGNTSANSSYSTLYTSTLGVNVATLSSLTVNYISGVIPYVTVATLAGGGIITTFSNPYGVAVDSAGNIYVADTVNNRTLKITPAGLVTTLASENRPSGIALDFSGNVYVAEQNPSNLIRKITPAGVLSILAGGGSTGTGATGFADGQGTAATFSRPSSVAVDSSGNIYVADSLNHIIRKITPGGLVTTIAGGGGSNLSGTTTNAQGSNARFNNPAGVAVDSSGNIYVADTINNRIQQITPVGFVTTVAGGGSTAGSANGQGTNATFYTPGGIVVDPSGNIYVSDQTSNLIRKITSGGLVTTIAGGGTGVATNGKGTIATFNNPYGLALDSSGNIYIADVNNSLIRKIQFIPNIIQVNCDALGINNNVPQYTVDVTGTIRASGDVIAFSDRRVKTNITTIDSGLSMVNALRGVYYTRTDTSEPALRHIGLIAQEVEEVLPEVIRTDTSEQQMKSVAYGNIVAVLIEGIKELSQRLAPLETLSTQVAVLQWQNTCLQSTIGSFMMR